MSDRYIEAEKRLAELLGWVWNPSDYQWKKPDGFYEDYLPGWTNKNGATFALMVEHGCYPSERDGMINVLDVSKIRLNVYATTEIADHPSKEAAVRYAIVQAVIAKLEAQ